MPDQLVACLPIASLERGLVERALFQSTISYVESMVFWADVAPCTSPKTRVSVSFSCDPRGRVTGPRSRGENRYRTNPRRRDLTVESHHWASTQIPIRHRCTSDFHELSCIQRLELRENYRFFSRHDGSSLTDLARMADPVSQDATPSAARTIPNSESNNHKYIAGQSHAALEAARDELRRQLSASRQRLVEELREAQAAAKVRIARGR